MQVPYLPSYLFGPRKQSFIQKPFDPIRNSLPVARKCVFLLRNGTAWELKSVSIWKKQKHQIVKVTMVEGRNFISQKY